MSRPDLRGRWGRLKSPCSQELPFTWHDVISKVKSDLAGSDRYIVERSPGLSPDYAALDLVSSTLPNY
jgi:hypothetical protein